jgi:two-component system, OmpR family, sensor histidine kinase TctE
MVDIDHPSPSSPANPIAKVLVQGVHPLSPSSSDVWVPELTDNSVLAGLRSRLIVMLLIPLVLLALTNAWIDYRAAGSAAAQQDQSLKDLLPLMVGSVVAEPPRPGEPPVILLAPTIEDFIKQRANQAAWGLASVDGGLLIGESWLATPTPSTDDPEFHSEVVGGVTYRIAVQRAQTAAGEYIVLLADGSDARQDWVRSLIFKVIVPNLLLIIAAFFAINWAVHRALKPLIDIKRAVERRSPQDLSALDAEHTPTEVRPLVESLNRLFALVNAQAESQRRFIADAAHQLRTPLAGLQSQVEAWAQQVKTTDSSSFSDPKQLSARIQPAQSAITLGASEINRLLSATRRTSQLANQLLALSRADAHTMAQQPRQQVDLADICTSVLEQHLDEASAHGIDLGLDIAETGAPYTVSGYDWLLRELVSNLTDNAIRYTSEAALHSDGSLAATPAASPRPLTVGAVTLRLLRESSSHIVLQVCDDGPGIAPAERSRVTERFYRVQGSSGQGNGLGLAIADEIARLHEVQMQLHDALPPDPATGQRPARAGLVVSLRFAVTGML